MNDRLWFTPRRDANIRRQVDGALCDVSDDDDLCLRAARLLASTAAERGQTVPGVTIRVAKRLPIGGGLGGGSSNAATVLVALNYYWQLAFSPQRLAELGLQLGADVPVFIHSRAAWAEGVGERLTPLALDQPWFTVLIPPVQVATATVFADPQLTRDSRPATMRAELTGFGNDCEAVVYRRYPAVAETARLLAERAQAHSGEHVAVRLTGTGGCVFAAFDEREKAQAVLAGCEDDGACGFVSRGSNRSLLQDRLQQATMTESFFK